MQVLTCSFLIPINTRVHFATTAGNLYQGISLGQKTMGISQGYGRNLVWIPKDNLAQGHLWKYYSLVCGAALVNLQIAKNVSGSH